MPGHTTRRRYTLQVGRDAMEGDLDIEDVEAFLDDHVDRNPELVSVTFAVDDSVRDSATTN